jgi:membrane-bound lytic murein transglycosylase B
MFASEIEARYGVDRNPDRAIWGMETSFGAVIGNFDARNVLANMAVEGRRQILRRSANCSTVMKIVERGDAVRSDLIAGWAGAMGRRSSCHPAIYAYAEDFDGDGRQGRLEK